MPNEDRWRAQMRALCDDVGPDDGLSTDEIHKLERRSRRPDNPTRRLAGQIKRALELALGAADDPWLQGLVVVTCEPGDHRGRFRVVVRPYDDDDLPIAWERLQLAQGWLRAQVAESVQRKSAPELRFVMDPSVGRGGEP